ncbi:MAG TPA: rhodanese-like domain-containing protein [Noviherbaspirillum sp.]|nr:rhodanese-like domain-containing protein [Noviherbaspirillum sp.]
MGIFARMLGLDTEALPQKLPEDAILLDVRSPAEYEAGHLRDAILLPLNAITMHIGRIVRDKGAPIVVYCQSGARSASARQMLMQMGYQKVFNGGGVRTLAEHMQREIVR